MNVITEHSRKDGTATLILDGRFDAHEIPFFREARNKLEGDGIDTITVNLANVKFVDSAALAELVSGMKRARERRGDLILAEPSNPVQVILELTRLDSAFQII